MKRRNASSIKDKLESIAWDFVGASTNQGPHRIHPYPARFIAQIPGTLIDLFHDKDGSTVLDPFCGSGTTLVEAASRGIPSIGIDLHPLAILISKVKTTPLKESLSGCAINVVAQAKRLAANGRLEIPPIPRLDHWFKRDIQIGLTALVTAINSITDNAIADALRVSLSSIIVRVSNQDSDTRYAAVEKKLSQYDLWEQFERSVAKTEDAIGCIGGDLLRNAGSVRLLAKDLMTVEPVDIGSDVGLVVTSPPYPNAYEYWLYHKYRMYWLGMDPLAVRKAEIGARAHYFKKNHQTEHDFERQMARCFWLLSEVMRDGALACFVVGRSQIHGRLVNNEALLERAAHTYGFQKITVVSRVIARNRKSFNLSHAGIVKEGILVFQLRKHS